MSTDAPTPEAPPIDETAAKPVKPTVKAIPTPKAPPAPKFGGFMVHVAGFGAWKAGDVVSAKQLAQANVDADRLDQLKTEGVLSEVWS